MGATFAFSFSHVPFSIHQEILLALLSEHRCDRFSSLLLSLVKVTIISSLDYSNKLLTGLPVSPLISCVAARVRKMAPMRALFSFKPRENSHHTEWKAKSRLCGPIQSISPHIRYHPTPRRAFDISHGQLLPISLTLLQPYWPHCGLNMPAMLCVLAQGLDTGWSLCWTFFHLKPGNVNSAYPLHVCSNVAFSMYLVPSSWTLNSLYPALLFLIKHLQSYNILISFFTIFIISFLSSPVGIKLHEGKDFYVCLLIYSRCLERC